MDPLTAALGDAPPASVLALSDGVRARLAAQVEHARTTQHELVETSVATALRGVPFPLRGVVKRALRA